MEYNYLRNMQTKKRRKMRKVLLSIVAILIMLPTLGLAADLRTTELVSKEEVPKNLYLAGQNPTVDANVLGDLVIAGGVVTVNGEVQNGLLVAGGTLNINGKVGGNVRVAGGTVIIESTVEGDLVVFGGDVILGTKSVVSGDLLVFGGTVTMKGEIVGSVKKGFVGDVVIAGNVGGDVDLANVTTLRLDNTANIGGNLKYSSKNEASIASSAKVGGKVLFTKITTTSNAGNQLTSNIKYTILGLVMALITILAFVYLLPKFSKEVINTSLVNPWAKMGIGFLAMIATPIVLFMLLLTFVGWSIMGYLGVAYLSLWMLTGSLTTLLVGSFIWKYIRKEAEFTVNWKVAAMGVVTITILKMIPVVGWLIAFVLSLIVFGTLVTMILGYLKTQRA
jgi:hypothetical protein